MVIGRAAGILTAALGLMAVAGLLRGASAARDDSVVPALQVWRADVPDVETARIAAQPLATDPLPAREALYPALPDRPSYTVYFPEGPAGPRQTVIALHGMGGSGPGVAAPLLATARANGWVLVAPTISYGEWRDPAQLTGEELRLMPQLDRLIDYVRDEAGVEISGRVLLFGFSRGAQAALRFSMLYPERVEAVAALSAGTYTLPLRSVSTPAGPAAAMMPFGVANLEELAGRGVDQLRMAGVRYLIEVGGSDNKDGDVPRQWDTFVGKNRVERATTYAAVLKDLGCETSLVVVPGAGHELNGAMMEQATSFLTVAAARAKPETTMLVSLSGLDLSGNHVE